MTAGLNELQEELRVFLRDHGLPALNAWGERPRLQPGEAVAAVSLRALECAPPGFQDYLGEEYHQETGRWVERYGKRAGITFGVDLYGATAETVRAGINTLSLALSREGPRGLRPVSLHVGETTYQEESHRYFCPAQAEFSVWMTAAGTEGESFLDFTIKGEGIT